MSGRVVIKILGTLLLLSTVFSESTTTTKIPTVNYTECSPVFKYKETYFHGCTDSDSDGVPWCLLKAPVEGSTWGYCDLDTLPIFYNIDGNSKKDCDISSKLEDGSSIYGCYSLDQQKTYICKAGGKVQACTVNLQIDKNNDANSKDNKNTINGKPRNSSGGMLEENQSDNGSNMSLQVILILSCLGGLAVVSVILLFLFRRAKNQAARRKLTDKVSKFATQSSINLYKHDSNLNIKAPAPSQNLNSIVRTSTNFSNYKLSPNLQKEYIVLSSFTPTLADELIIKPGDKVVVYKEYDDGWAQGANITRGNTKGVFPKYCIESNQNSYLLPSNPSPTSKRSSSNTNYQNI